MVSRIPVAARPFPLGAHPFGRSARQRFVARMSDKGSNRRIKVIRTMNGKKVERGVDLDDVIQPGDTLVIPQRLL